MFCNNMIVCLLILGKLKDDKKYTNPKDNDGYTPLTWAVYHGMEMVCQQIIENLGKKISKESVSTYYQFIIYYFDTSYLD